MTCGKGFVRKIKVDVLEKTHLAAKYVVKDFHSKNI